MKIEWAYPTLGNKEREYVNDALESTYWGGSGKYVKLLEKSIENMTGNKALVVNNGSNALLLPLIYLLEKGKLKKGDRIGFSTYSYVVTANIPRFLGFKLVPIDADRKNLNVTPEILEKFLQEHRVKAVILVDVAGLPVEQKVIEDICERRGIIFIEDAAEALGSEYERKMVGSFSHITTLSFHAAKVVAAGEGGAITAPNGEFIEWCRNFREYGKKKNPWYIHETFGLNFKMSNILAALAYAQIEQLDEIVSQRNKVATMYKELENFSGYIQQIPPYVTRTNWFLVQWIVPNKVHRKKVLKQLERNEIPYRIAWTPIHKQPIYNLNANCPNAEWIYEHVISLPIGNAMPREHVEYVLDSIKGVFK